VSDSVPTGTADKGLDIERIKGRIEQLAAAHFAKGEQRYFLSRLGNELGTDRSVLEKLTGVKLTQFVRENLPYEIGAGGSHQNVLFLIAPDGTPTASAKSSGAAPRYAPRFWAAFAVPLAEGEDRVINLDSFDFGPTEKIGVDGASVRPIAPEFIAPKEASGSAAETAERIVAWLAAQGLDGARFYAVPRDHRSDGRSLLDRLFAVLDHDQLRRISLPLDVIKALAERKF
jgi:hypothetical protein